MSYIKKYPGLRVFSVNFCNQLTKQTLDYLITKSQSLEELCIAGIPDMIQESLATVICNSRKRLAVVDFSFNPETSFHDKIFTELGTCSQLESINFFGNSLIRRHQIDLLSVGERDPETDEPIREVQLMKLQHVNFNQLVLVSDGNVLKLIDNAPCIKHLELNGMDLIGEYALGQIISELKGLKMLQINGTTSISEEKFVELRDKHKGRLRLIRNILVQGDPNNNGLEIPLF